MIASHGSLSYTVFIYQCDLIKWRKHNAAIGYTAGPHFFQNHPLSRTPNVINIDCVNQPTSNLSNVVYDITNGTVIHVCSPPCVNGNCITNGTCYCESGWTGSACDISLILQGAIFN